MWRTFCKPLVEDSLNASVLKNSQANEVLHKALLSYRPPPPPPRLPLAGEPQISCCWRIRKRPFSKSTAGWCLSAFSLTVLLRRRGVGIVHRRQLCLQLSSIVAAKTASPLHYFSVLIDQWAMGHAVGEVLEPHCCKTQQITTSDSMCCAFWTGCYSSAWTFKPSSTQTLDFEQLQQ